MEVEQRQAVRFLFLKLHPEWRRLPAELQIKHKAEFARTVREFRARLLLRTYSLMGTRGDSDLLFWQAAPSIETLQAFETAVFSTRLGSYLETTASYLSMTKRSVYDFPDDPETGQRLSIKPADCKYLFVYPFIKTREWYRLPQETRQDMMAEHVRIGRQYTGVRVNTTYSFGLDDQEFVVTFESESPDDFLDLVMELRGSAASAYTERDTPVFTCIQMSIWDALDSLGGSRANKGRASEHGAGDRFIEVGTLDEVPEGTSKRVYLDADAVALFNVSGTVYAVNDRCPHGRASLSEGSIDPNTCVLTCPWHEGTFALADGRRLSGPPRVGVEAFDVRVVDDRILVRRRGQEPQIGRETMSVTDASPENG
jgi:chlorite dismutase